MTRIPEPASDATGNRDPVAIIHPTKLGQGHHGLLGCVDGRYVIQAATGVSPVELLNFHLLDVARVRKHDRTQIHGGSGRKDRSVEAVEHQFRQKPAMVYVSMRQDDCRDRFRVEGKGAVIQSFLGLRPLEQSTVYQKARPGRRDQEARPRNGLGRAMEVELDGVSPQRVGYLMRWHCLDRDAGEK